NSAMPPAGVIRPIAPPPPGAGPSANQRLPSGPAVRAPGGRLLAVGSGKSVMAPAGVIRPIAPGPGPGPADGSCTANQRSPSGPTVRALEPGTAPAGSGNSAMPPAGVIRPIAPPPPGADPSANQKSPSGPTVRSPGSI